MIRKIKKEFGEINNDKDKIGFQMPIYCDHPILDKKIPVFIANFVLEHTAKVQYLVVQPMMKEITNLPKNIHYQ